MIPEGVPVEITPKLRMEFESYDAAYDYTLKYAAVAGFGIVRRPSQCPIQNFCISAYR